ncbi:hypothetical protein DBB_3330 [Desulfoluna spongiiphila]|nr:hypothetical protein DBB_3330 [Desulfoluna spongiiphila]
MVTTTYPKKTTGLFTENVTQIKMQGLWKKLFLILDVMAVVVVVIVMQLMYTRI